jgi:diguanylate cyclase (GGDEF)-like protein
MVDSYLGSTHRLARLLLGSDPRMQLRLTRFFAGAAMYLFCSLLAILGFWWNLVDAPAALAMSVPSLIGSVGFYAALRSGWSQRLADPALTLPQCVFAILSISLGYGLSPEVRGAVPALMALVQMFGAFMLPPRDCRRLGAFSVVALAAGILAGVSRSPEVFDPRIESIHFLLGAAVLWAISVLAGQLSKLRALQQAQKLELRGALAKVQQLATHDELTGLPNRRQVMELLAHEERRAMRQEAPLCVCLIDIDYFKNINDSFGHLAGDTALRRFADIVGEGLRAGDVLARWGGEEFILLLPATQRDEATRVLERLRLRCVDRGNWTDRPELQVHFSAGLSAHVAGEPTQLVIARADAALYQAKRSGRNRLEIA